MSNLVQIAKVVGAEIGGIEKSHLAHVSEGVSLLSSLLAAGESLGVPFATQQRVLAPTLEALGKLAEVGQGYAQTHQHLSAFVRKHGLDPKAFGESDSGPSALLRDASDFRVAA